MSNTIYNYYLSVINKSVYGFRGSDHIISTLSNGIVSVLILLFLVSCIILFIGIAILLSLIPVIGNILGVVVIGFTIVLVVMLLPLFTIFIYNALLSMFSMIAWLLKLVGVPSGIVNSVEDTVDIYKVTYFMMSTSEDKDLNLEKDKDKSV